MNRSDRTRYSLRNLPTDPITNVSITAPARFQLRLAPHSPSYDSVSLAKTILASPGPPRDPITQIPIPKNELERLDAAVQRAGQHLPSVARLLRRAQHPAPSSVQCLLDLMDMRIGEVLSAIFSNFDQFHHCPANTASYYQLYFMVMMVQLPEIIRCLQQMHQYDIAYTRHIGRTVIDRLRGPPNCPTIDPSDSVLEPALQHLETFVRKL